MAHPLHSDTCNPAKCAFTMGTLGYWKTRGTAQAIRLLLAHTGESFTEEFYEIGPGPEFSRDEWLDVKDNLDLDFPNLPYYIDGENKVTNSAAILRYLGRKHNICGKTEKERIRVDIIAEELKELRDGFIRLCYLDYKMLRPKYKKELPKKLKPFQNFLGKNKFLAGEEVTYVDFVLYELIDVHNVMFPECLEKTNLKDYHARVADLPKVKEFMASDKFLKGPINNKMAKCFNE